MGSGRECRGVDKRSKILDEMVSTTLLIFVHFEL